MGKIYFPMDHTPDEWRAMSRESHRREQESFDRCDTDGFLSQWAHTMTARLYSLLADVAEAGGVWNFRLLADADGNIIEGAREVQTRYGRAWVTPDDRWFRPSRAQDEAVAKARDLAKGFQIVYAERPAVVTLQNDGSLWGCSPIVLPKRERVESREG